MIFNDELDENIKKEDSGKSYETYSGSDLMNIKITESMTDNIEILQKIIGGNADLVHRFFTLGRSRIIPAAIFYFENLVDSKQMNANIMQPLLSEAYTSGLRTGPEILSEIQCGNLITSAEIKAGRDMKELTDGLLIGDVVLLIEGINEAYIINSKGYEYRNIKESEIEPNVKGPRDSFNEVLRINLGLIRRRIPSPNLMFEPMNIGRITQTRVCIAYIKGVCSPKLVNEVRERISKIDIDGILASSYIEEFINDSPFSLFPQVRNTERPDVACGALLEGRIVVLTDNTPISLVIPGEFFSLTHASEDYYNRYTFSTLIRLLRFFSFAIALTLPAFYIAIVNFHQELIPTRLLISIISARSGVPLPNFAEAILMETAFEMLREAGVRLPRPVGPAVSIVGGLVIGQAAVQANIVSPLMVIVVSLTAIATFTIPQYNISLSIRVLRFFLMILSSVLGLFGLMIGLLFILIHVCSLRTFGVPYFSPVAPLHISDLKDTIVRSPLWTFVKRPTETSANRNRMASGKMPKPPENRSDET